MAIHTSHCGDTKSINSIIFFFQKNRHIIDHLSKKMLHEQKNLRKTSAREMPGLLMVACK